MGSEGKGDYEFFQWILSNPKQKEIVQYINRKIKWSKK